MKQIFLVLLFMVSFNSLAVNKQQIHAKEAKVVSDMFFISQMFGTRMKSSFHDRCDDNDNTISCSEVVCSKLPAHKCDEMWELRDVTKMCSSVRSGKCIESFCNHMPTHKCDEMWELKDIATSCSGVPTRAVNTVCSYLPAHKCDEMWELNDIAKLVRGKGRQVIKCLKFTCGQLASHKCDEMWEITNVVDACSGN